MSLFLDPRTGQWSRTYQPPLKPAVCATCGRPGYIVETATRPVNLACCAFKPEPKVPHPNCGVAAETKACANCGLELTATTVATVPSPLTGAPEETEYCLDCAADADWDADMPPHGDRA